MKATRTFLPRASSPESVDGPSAIISPSNIWSPTLTNGLWFIQVDWFDLWNFFRLYISTPKSPASRSPLEVTTILWESTWSTIPSLVATTDEPESLATVSSIPVPTKGASFVTNGTACLIIFDPIRALFASSFSRKGINAAATDTVCWGLTSTKSTEAGGTRSKSPSCLQLRSSDSKLPFSSAGSSACAILYLLSSTADK